MQIFSDLRELTPNQRNAVLASFLGWTLDAFDFFIIVFVLADIAKEFGTDIPSVTATLFLTLAMRPVGAFLFGILADRFGRRPILMINILFYSGIEFLSGFAPSLTVLVILRGLYGIAMGVPGFTYQLGNLFASKNGTIQATLAVSFGNNYGLALAITAAIVAIAVAALTALGPEAHGVTFGDR
jgi:SHS family lactate transporter-like MFS transporter